ncbi:hypothetical protein H0W91_03980 [Patescibacteria group bacterium]|nr:hypothetical protein [Patescibacteria group bacterium]
MEDTLEQKTIKSQTNFSDIKYNVPYSVIAPLDILTAKEINLDKKTQLRILRNTLHHGDSRENVEIILQHAIEDGVISEPTSKAILASLDRSIIKEQEKKLDKVTPKIEEGIKEENIKNPIVTEVIEKKEKEIELPPEPEFSVDDKALEDAAKNSLKAGNTTASLEKYALNIKDGDFKIQVLSDLAAELVQQNKFEDAKKFIEEIADPEYKKEMFKWVQEMEKVQKPNEDKGVEKETVIEPEIKKVKAKNKKIKVDTDPVVETPPANSGKKIEKKEAEEITTKEGMDTIDSELAEARSIYAERMVEWKNTLREKKSKIGKMFADLGVERHIPEIDRPIELIEAENAYIQAKKNKSQKILEKAVYVPKALGAGEIIEKTEKTIDRLALMNQVGKEWNLLAEALEAGATPLEKGKIRKALEKWGRMDKRARVALTGTAFFAGGMLLGGMTLTGAAVFGGYRAVRAGVGTVTSLATGKVVDKYQKEGNELRKSEILEKYSNGIDEANFEKREREAMRAFEKEQNKKKRQILWKAGAMIGVGAGATMAMGSVENALNHSDVSEHLQNSKDINLPSQRVEDINLPKSGVVAESLPTKPNVLPQDVEIPKASSVVEVKIPEVGVNISSKGFTQTIMDLKKGIRDEYGDNIPEGIKENIMDKSSIELAKELKFYDPSTHESGIGYAGEKLLIDAKGNLAYEHIGGGRDVMLDTKTGSIDTFHGKTQIINPESTDQIESPIVSEITPDPEIPITNALEGVGVPVNVDPLPLNTVIENTDHIPYNNVSVDISHDGPVRTIVFNGNEIAKEDNFGGIKHFFLKDAYQDKPFYKEFRGAFATAFEKNMPQEFIGKVKASLDFENGKIHILQGVNKPDDVIVLLNGKEIAKGVVSSNGPKVSFDPELKGGWLLADNAFERAWKATKGTIKTLRA